MAGTGPLTGKVFSGRYQIGELLGIGGMAEVYSAQDMTLGRIVAVKTMLPQYASDPDFTRRFRQEAAAAANIQSPYIVNVYDWGHDQDTYFIVMEFVRGSDLKTAIQQRGAINQRKVAEIGSQVCQALTVAHQQDIIHRDIKPQNIMIQPDGNIKVMDFGIARAKNSTADKTQTVLGTAHYTSPEQAQGQDLTASSDIYSLGVVLYEAATGTLPFDGTDAVSVALMQVRDEPPLPRSINPDIDPVFEAIILTAMQKDPEARFATANDMRVALNDYLAGRPINFAALVAGGAALGAAATAVMPQAAMGAGYDTARTSVMQPIGAMDSTQIMPIQNMAQTGAMSPAQAGARRYNSRSDDTPKKSKKGPIIGVIVLIVAIAAIAGFMLMNGGKQAQVPDVVGKTYEEARIMIEDAGFKVGERSTEYDDEVESGLVLRQTPGANSQAPEGSEIDLVISQGSEQVEVPDVLGMTESEARKEFSAKGFILDNIDVEESEDVEKGKIISQDPQPGTKANSGSMVSIVVSGGVEEQNVPDITGKDVEEARAIAEDAGFTIQQGRSEASDTVPEGSIILQDPKAGDKAKKGSIIYYRISTGPSNISIESFVGSDSAYAIGRLEGAGFKVSVTEKYSDEPAGRVIAQSTTAAKKGSTIKLTVSKGPKPGASSSSAATDGNQGDKRS